MHWGQKSCYGIWFVSLLKNAMGLKEFQRRLLQNPITYNPSILLVFKQSYSGKLKTMHRLPKGMVHLEKKKKIHKKNLKTTKKPQNTIHKKILVGTEF